tara:strand:+ start:1348 stop:2622 length:1275 start_codon:yes stop_codon:yes gene_type:complete
MISDKLVAVDLEIASTCNAACPVCIRRLDGRLSDFKQQMRTLEDVKVIFEGIAHKIQQLTLCGNYGDPMTCNEIVPICEWFREQSPDIHIHISTNGGIGKKTDYERLGELGVSIIFGIDGASHDVLKLHRVNVSYFKVIENLSSFVSHIDYENNSFAQASWQYILFDENKQDLLKALIKAKELGVKNFNIRRPNGFGGDTRIPVYGFDHPEFTHWLTPVTAEFQNKNIFNNWAICLDEQYEEILAILSSITPVMHHNGPLWDGIKWDTPFRHWNPELSTPWTGNEKYTVNIPENINKELSTFQSQTCFSLNYKENHDLTKEALYVFISHDNYVYPCCMVGSAVSMAKQKSRSLEANSEHIKELLNSVSAYDYENFSLKNKNLKQVLDSAYLHETYYEQIKTDATTFCKLQCGKCSTAKSSYSAI